MVIGLKDTLKLMGITIVACCAVFVCTLFLNYNMDLASIQKEVVTEAGKAMVQAKISMGKGIAAVTGGCLILTSVVLLLFYIKNYIDIHGKELGILKALGYSNLKIAKNFWVFGLSVLAGCVLGQVLAFLYMPVFYEAQNAEGLFPNVLINFHPLFAFLLAGLPAAFFAFMSVGYACISLKKPALDLLREKRVYKTKTNTKETNSLPFLQDLRKNTLRGKKTLVFFVVFSAFCFSAMVQMSMSMEDLASETYGIMMLVIGLILAFMTLFLSLSSVMKGNTKTIAMMRVFGYEYKDCSKAILGGYRLVSYLGFAIGTIYQYVLLKLMLGIVFADIENVPEYRFDYQALVITFSVFVISYEIVMRCFSLRIRKLSIKTVMLE